MTSVLFSPIKIGSLELDNRIVVAPMCTYSAADGCATDWHMTHLGSLANSGAGLVVVEATAVERRGRISHGCLGLYSDACEDAIARVLAHCKRIGTSKFAAQLAHAGRKASSQIPFRGRPIGLGENEDPWTTIGPSAVAASEDYPPPKAATQADLADIREAFVNAARRAVRVGYDAVELHMAHGYLLHSFMSPLGNVRTDAYGGAFENRMRFPVDVTRAVRSVLPKGMPLGARITGTDWAPEGLTPDDAVSIAKSLKDVGLDYCCVSSGAGSADPHMVIGPEYQVPFAARVRQGTGMVTRAVGLIATPKQAERVLADGKADQIALGRAFLDDPHWAWHAARALGADVKRPPQYARAAPDRWAGASY